MLVQLLIDFKVFGALKLEQPGNTTFILFDIVSRDFIKGGLRAEGQHTRSVQFYTRLDFRI